MQIIKCICLKTAQTGRQIGAFGARKPIHHLIHRRRRPSSQHHPLLLAHQTFHSSYQRLRRCQLRSLSLSFIPWKQASIRPFQNTLQNPSKQQWKRHEITGNIGSGSIGGTLDWPDVGEGHTAASVASEIHDEHFSEVGVPRLGLPWKWRALLIKNSDIWCDGGAFKYTCRLS